MGTITFIAGGNLDKECTNLSVSCTHTFASGTTVAIKVTVTSTNASQFTWSDGGFLGSIDSQPPCPADTDGSTTSGALIRSSGSIMGVLTCTWTMTAANKALGFHGS